MALSFNDVKGLIQFDNVSAKLYDEVANETALCIANSDEIRDANKSTQLRKYYDEFCMWDQKIKQNPDKYGEYLPLIKMLNAKVAYANGRKLVDRNFVDLMRHCLGQLTDKKESFERCKLFFEAFMGFYKMYKSK
jgi:CRISPR-associated protein Csm2